MSRAAVLDASAILAVLHAEDGFEKVLPHLQGGLVSAVNYSEVLKKAVERGMDVNQTRSQLLKFRLRVVAFDERHAVRAAEIWGQCKPYGLSAADRACIALGLLEDTHVITADLRMQDVDLPTRIVVIRGHATRKRKSK